MKRFLGRLSPLRLFGRSGDFDRHASSRTVSFHWTHTPKPDTLINKGMALLGIMTIPAGILYYRQTHIEDAPFPGRKRVMWLPQKAQELVERYAGEGIEEEFKNILLPADHPLTVIVTEIGKRLVNASGDLGAKYDWRFYVVDNAAVNAMCLPGGTVIVNTGLFNICETKEELAVVMAHEIGHGISKHGVEILGANLMHMAGMMLLQLSFGFQIYTLGTWTTNKLKEFLFDLPMSQNLEREADYVGLMLMAKACYDPHVAPKVLGNLGSGVTEENKYFSTHPPDEERAQNCREWMPLAEEIQRKSCESTLRLFGRVLFRNKNA